MTRVMIVDDDPDILKLVEKGLKKAGYQVAAAETAEVALEKIARTMPDLIITDAMMPGKDGFELSQELRHNSETASVPIIMLTALHQEQDALKAFQDGVDDFVTKPFSMPVLHARVAALLNRSRVCQGLSPLVPVPVSEEPLIADRVSIGIAALDNALGGGIPKGSNVLVIGETGVGKSYLSRRFIAGGLADYDRCMMILMDDDPKMVRNSINRLLPKTLNEYEKEDYFRLVDCFSWSRGSSESNEKFAISGKMELNQLAALIADAGSDIGQTVAEKLGGRRVLDSVSSIFIDFELASVQRFLAQIARTASSYGGVTTLLILEAGSISEKEENNIKYLMDVVMELKYDGARMARVANMKWSKFSRDWIEIPES
jgi:CheY-like chemotaxis protein